MANLNGQEEILRYYNGEITYLRRAGLSFATRYPKLAARLELSGDHSPDPHVERLIESFAFLTARIHRQIDAEFPQITTALLGTLYPNLVNPVPSMGIAKFDVDPYQGKLSTGHVIPKHTSLFAQTGDGLTCRFRTCYPVILWPFEVERASFESPDQFEFLNCMSHIAMVLRLRLVPRGITLGEMKPGKLRFFLRGDSTLVNSLYELLFCHGPRVAILPESGRNPVFLPDNAIVPVGFGADEDVLPCPENAHPAYRLVQEYFLFPQKYHFFDLDHLQFHRSQEELDVLILLTQMPPARLTVDRETFCLGCTPIVNLFRKTTEPIRLDQTQLEYRLIPDMRRERTHEIHSIISVSSSSNHLQETERLEPFFSFQHRRDGKEHRAFWHAQRLGTGREDLPGTEVYLSFLDLDFEPNLPPVQTVFAHTLCTNRDLAGQLPAGARLQIENAAPLNRISCLDKPSDPAYPPLEGSSLWALISNLSLNYLSLSGGKESLEALREILRLYSFSDAPSTHKQLQGIRQMSCRRVVRRVGPRDWRGFCQGTEITLEFDEDLYAGSSAFLLGAVLRQFFALYASINTFTQLVITRSSQREGEWKRWPLLAGYQPVM
ncbi:MAG: type VI secretion system baseplate subunit TssF [Acidobacteriia bacterium]|nr:type VI secretion system baseplate subunit TssF [Terriglobia bacterium]